MEGLNCRRIDISDIDISYVNARVIETKATLYRNYEAQELQSSNLRCVICKTTFASIVKFRKHLHSHNPLDISSLLLCETDTESDSDVEIRIGDALCSENNKARAWIMSPDPIFQVTLCIENSLDIHICNIGNRKMKLGHAYVVNQTNATLNLFEECTLEIGESTIFSLNMNLIDPHDTNTVIIQAFNGEYEYIEKLELIACCTKPDELMKTLELVNLDVCPTLKAILNKSDEKIDFYFKSERSFAQKLDYTSYTDRFSELSMLERIENQYELDKYKQEDVLIFSVDNYKRFRVYVKNVKDKMSQLTKYDSASFTQMGNTTPLVIYAKIEQILKDEIVFERCEDVQSRKLNYELIYQMTFHTNGYTYDMEMAALKFVFEKGIVKHLFPDTVNSTLPAIEREFNWINSDISENLPQMQAVRHIVEGTAHPLPYILFGPPGTGKTKTLVEAIAQILMNDDNSRILVCATSNSAADELALRLIRNLPNQCWKKHNIYRIYSSSFTPQEPIDDDLLQSSNFHLKYIPELRFLSKFRIIVATPLIGGTLRYGGLDPHYFTHLFIDECGSSTEISTLLPIACAPHARIVLSGDPKQLGPVVTSTHASRLGLGISLLERLEETNAYQKNPQTNIHNANVITKLVYNYRSHPAIISPSNNLFYDGDLIAKGDTKKTHCFVNWTELPSIGTPIIFHASSNDKSQRENNSSSIFNMTEVHIIVNYVQQIMRECINGKQVQENDIGIISPYKKQCQKIKKQLEREKLKDIMVSTVELFQGKEKPIILVSTTRCKMGGIGFLKSPQRLNVLLTRAQCLMIIVGDPYTLKLDKNWNQVLTEFQKAGVCNGHSFDVKKHGRYEAKLILGDAANWNRAGRYTRTRRNDSKTDEMVREFNCLKLGNGGRAKTEPGAMWR